MTVSPLERLSADTSHISATAGDVQASQPCKRSSSTSLLTTFIV